MRLLDSQSNPAPAKATTAATVRWGLPLWLIALILGVATIGVYWPATGHDFVNYDDNLHVTSNGHVQQGLTLKSMGWALSNAVNCNWHPLTMWSHMLDCQMFGLCPWGHHLTNVLLHAVNALLVFALLLQMTQARWRSLFVAAVFSFHPLRVESVAWVAERKDVLSACLGLLALTFYIRYVTGRPKSEPAPASPEVRPSMLHYWLSVFFFALGLMSKPTLVTWPFVMLLLDYWPLRRFGVERLWWLVMEKIPFMVMAGVASLVTVIAQRSAGAMETMLFLPLSARSENALVSYSQYLGKLFWPADLAVFYPHPGHWPTARVLLAGGMLLGISGLMWALRRRSPVLLTGWLWFGGILVPMIGLVPSGGWAMADRHTYLASLGVLVLVTWGAYDLTLGWRHQRGALGLAGVATAMLCLGLTSRQLEHWQDSEALFRHAVTVSKNNYLAHNNLGLALFGKDRTQAAIRHFRKAIDLAPDFAAAHLSLGTVLTEQGDLDQAVVQLTEALRLQPGYAEAHRNLGNALVKQGHDEEAISQYREAIQLQPGDSLARNQLGLALVKHGHLDEAIRQHQEAVRLRPQDAGGHYYLGDALARKGRMDEAILQLREALRLQPLTTDAHYNLANALIRKGLLDEALSEYGEALRLKPSDADAHNNFGIALWQKGRNDEAIAQFQEALRCRPDHAHARRNLDSALATRARSAQSGAAIVKP